MAHDRISVRTEAGKKIEVVVTELTADAIWVAIGEGIHNVKCKLVPTANRQAYAGNVMGREIVYERSVEAVKQDLGAGRIERKPVKR